jgi:hypothetical protein
MNRKPTKRDIEALTQLARMIIIVAKGPPPGWIGVLSDEQKANQDFSRDTLEAVGIDWELLRGADRADIAVQRQSERKETMTEDREKAITVWSEVMEHVLNLAPPSIRQEIVATVVEKTKQWAKEQASGPDPFFYKRPVKPVRLDELDDQKPGLKYRNAIMEAVSLVIQVFVRCITNNHSDEDAAKILFREHRHGTGGCWLPEYLAHLPGLTVDLKEAAKVAAENGKSQLKFDFDEEPRVTS